MTVSGGVPLVVNSRKPKWKHLLFPEIPASRLSCFTSSSFRPKLGICIFSTVILAFVLALVAAYTQQVANTFTAPDLRLLRRMGESAKDSAVRSNDQMTTSLLPHLPTGNLVMSSFSLGTVLGMVLAGARDKTKEQILRLFGLTEEHQIASGFKELGMVVKTHQEGGNVTLQTANRIYSEQGFSILPDYSQHLEQHYGAKPVSVSFVEQAEKSRQEINGWVSDQTNSKIKDLLPSGSVSSDTRVVLVNALYFKGDWANKFNPKQTVELDFFVDPKTTVKVPMMRQKAKFGLKTIKELDDATALRMPYKGETLDMILILPNEKVGLDATEKKMQTIDLAPALADFYERGNVHTTIPNFKVESTLQLNEPMKMMGVTDVFDMGSADLSGISGKRDLFVSLVVQKAFIEVNEEGAEAAAATGAVMNMRSMVIDPEFLCNRPFYYMIRERSSGQVLFSGRVVNPLL